MLKWRESESESGVVDRNVIIVIFHVTKCNEQGMDKDCAIALSSGNVCRPYDDLYETWT